MRSTIAFVRIHNNFLLYISQKTKSRKTETLLGYLPERPEWAYSKFCEALNDDGQEIIVSNYLLLSAEGLPINGLY